MRMWHEDLIPVLPNKQLSGQWKELFQIKRAIEKHGTPRHLLVNKVLHYNIGCFKIYANTVYNEMIKRGMKPKETKLKEILSWEHKAFTQNTVCPASNYEHNWFNRRYLAQCYCNLEEKWDCGGIKLEEWEKIIDFAQASNLFK